MELLDSTLHTSQPVFHRNSDSSKTYSFLSVTPTPRNFYLPQRNILQHVLKFPENLLRNQKEIASYLHRSDQTLLLPQLDPDKLPHRCLVISLPQPVRFHNAVPLS